MADGSCRASIAVSLIFLQTFYVTLVVKCVFVGIVRK